MKEWVINNTTVTEYEYDNLINSNTVKMSGLEEKEDNTIYELSDNPIININNFTHRKPTIIRCMAYGIKKSKKYYIYKDVKFRVFAELMTTKKGEFYKSLYSEKRRGTCFDKSTEISISNEDSWIITAMCIDPFLVPSKKFIHCFVIATGKDGKEYVIDGTLNAVIEKEKYMEIYNAQIISKIKQNEFCDFLDYMVENKALGVDISIVEYLCFPNEVTKGIKKYIKTR